MLFNSRAFWVTVYIAAVLVPLVALVVVPTPAKWGFGWDVGIGLGFAGLTMMGIQFMLTARFRYATAPFGIDLIYYFHRYLAYVALAVLLAHPLVLMAVERSVVAELNPLAAPWPITAGVVSLLSVVGLVLSSAGRKRLALSYEAWKRAHLLLAIAAVVLAFVHMWGIGYYSGTPLSRGLWAVIGFSLLMAVARGRLLRPWMLSRRPYRITDVRAEPGDTTILTLEPDGHSGFEFLPGQFAWLTVRNSPFAMREHPFSIASCAMPGGRLEFAIKQLGDFTRQVSTLQAGEIAFVDSPYGVFSIDRYPRAAGYVFVAGGIGLAPMMGMLRALADRRDQRRHLLIAAHSHWDRVPFRSELPQLAAQLDLAVVHVLEEPPAEWTGERGWIDRELLARHLPAPRDGYEYFLCGPLPMTRIAERALHELGVPGRHVHTELFDLV